MPGQRAVAVAVKVPGPVGGPVPNAHGIVAEDNDLAVSPLFEVWHFKRHQRRQQIDRMARGGAQVPFAGIEIAEPAVIVAAGNDFERPFTSRAMVAKRAISCSVKSPR